MTAPVDVLAVMDADIALRRSIYDEGRGTKPIARTEQNAHNLACAIEARAAVAELIEAASAYRATICTYKASWESHDAHLQRRLDAALTRVSGGAK